MTDTRHRPLSADVAARVTPQAVPEITVEDVVRGGLLSLGNDPATVRITLCELGMLSESRPISRTCPVAQFVKSMVGDEYVVGVVSGVSILSGKYGASSIVLDNPWPVREFINAWDRDR